MATKTLTDTPANVAAVIAIIDKAMGYPVRGIDIGGGVHVPPDQGFTVTYQDPTDNGATWTYAIDAVVQAITGDSTKLARLSTAEKSALLAAISAAI